MILERIKSILIHHKWNNGQYLGMLNYVQYNRNTIDYYKLDIRTIDPKCRKEYITNQKVARRL